MGFFQVREETNMTTSVKVTAHCGPNKDVFFGIKMLPDDEDTTDFTILQDGESTEKYVYDERVAVVFERKKEEV